METLYCRACNTRLNHQNAEPHYGVNKARYNTEFQRICKTCIRQQRTNRKQQLVIQYKQKGCSKCGYSKNAAALDFHHIDGHKDNTVSYFIWKVNSMTRLRAEIEKCIILCSNCHRELHNPQLNLD